MTYGFGRSESERLNLPFSPWFCGFHQTTDCQWLQDMPVLRRWGVATRTDRRGGVCCGMGKAAGEGVARGNAFPLQRLNPSYWDLRFQRGRNAQYDGISICRIGTFARNGFWRTNTTKSIRYRGEVFRQADEEGLTPSPLEVKRVSYVEHAHIEIF